MPNYHLPFAILLFFLSFPTLRAQDRPNILWIITDDHRPDALECYNRVKLGTNESALGYVSSPNIDGLAAEGTLFVNAYTNSPACGPSRGALISGRYPFRTSHHAFELTHQNPDFVRPSFPQVLREVGYASAQFGKSGEYVYRWGPGQGFHNAAHYDYMLHFKHSLQKNGVGDLWGHSPYKMVNNKVVYQGTQEWLKRPDGTIEKYYVTKREGSISAEDIATRERLEKEFDVLRSYTRSNPNLIIGGRNPQPAHQTIDAKIVDEFTAYLTHENTDYRTSWGATAAGANTTKPLLVNLAFHLPHTPVLPPQKFREVFKTKNYRVPEFPAEAVTNLPPQLQKLHRDLNMSRMTAEEKQQAIQDYYAFCAHGDELIGRAVREFKAYCTRHEQEYLIVFTVGDHGWHLGEQGIEAKFGPWKQSVSNAMILVSSDKEKVPAGRVDERLVEFVDVAPTMLSAAGVSVSDERFNYLDGIDLFQIMETEGEVRDYILGEINLVAGPRAYLRSKDFAFSMRTRPAHKTPLNRELQWALDCPVADAELALYDLRTDPGEIHNVANHPDYQKLA
ncbi:MAG: sulfatase-like hydrolase/transferase, partial [Bacteroidota bacterium]